MTLELHRCLVDYLEQDRPCAVATVTRAKGSVPNDVGAAMLVDGDGTRIVGTVGGGALEHRALAECKEALAAGEHRAIKLELTEEQHGGIGMRCGGQAEIYIQVYGARPQLLLFGAGHVNRMLYRLAEPFGYTITVIDDRPEWCNVENYPRARLLVSEVGEAMDSIQFGPETFCVIATRDHDNDALVLRSIQQREARYVGLVASKRKTLTMLRDMRADGIDVKPLLERLAAPVGLALGGRSPADVALSILSEIHAVKNEGSGDRLGVTIGDLP